MSFRVIEKRPCRTCPYRTDVPVGTWHAEEFVKLLKNDRKDADALHPTLGATYGCHKYGKVDGEKSFCAGWLLDQRRRNYPALQLRLRFLREPGLFEEVHAVEGAGLDLYPSIEDMCAANGPAMTVEIELSLDEITVLWVLGACGYPMGPATLARYSGLGEVAVATAVVVLTRAGLVTIEFPGGTSRLATLTPAGEIHADIIISAEEMRHRETRAAAILRMEAHRVS